MNLPLRQTAPERAARPALPAARRPLMLPPPRVGVLVDRMSANIAATPRGPKRLDQPPWARAVAQQVDPEGSFAGAHLAELPRAKKPKRRKKTSAKTSATKRAAPAKRSVAKRKTAKKSTRRTSQVPAKKSAKKGTKKRTRTAAKKRAAPKPMGRVRVTGTLRLSPVKKG